MYTLGFRPRVVEHSQGRCIIGAVYHFRRYRSARGFDSAYHTRSAWFRTRVSFFEYLYAVLAVALYSIFSAPGPLLETRAHTGANVRESSVFAAPTCRFKSLLRHNPDPACVVCCMCAFLVRKWRNGAATAACLVSHL